MKQKSFMVIAGEASGDLLAAELVSALRTKLPDADFFGAGGPKMSAAGVTLALDLTQHSVIGISDVVGNYFKFRGFFNQLLALAIERKPDVVIGVDYGGFNLRFGHAIKEYVRNNPSANWNPKIVQLVSPQVWASRPGRAKLLEADYDLLLSIFSFEKDWYAQRAPNLHVEFIGHPMLDRISKVGTSRPAPTSDVGVTDVLTAQRAVPTILVLPGSRKSELQRHLPAILPSLKLIREKLPNANVKMVLPDESLAQLAKSLGANLEIQIDNLPEALAEATIAIASTGTVTMECAFFGVPTVTLYKTSWLTYQIAKRIVTVKSLTMPNLLAKEEIYPEFVQDTATPENIAGAALELLQNESHRAIMKSQLVKVIGSLGEPGASERAATAILSLLQ